MNQRPQLEVSSDVDDVLGVKCNFETECAWIWNETVVDGFHVVSGANLTDSNRTGIMPGPAADLLNDANGHFLHLRLTKETGPRALKSPMFSTTRENCHLEVFLHMSAMQKGSIRVVIEPVASLGSAWLPGEIMGNDERRWNMHTFRIDRITKDFNILLEVFPNGIGGRPRGHVSIDNLRMKNCFAENPNGGNCSTTQVQCSANKVSVCIKPERICDLSKECDENEDENQNCGKNH